MTGGVPQAAHSLARDASRGALWAMFAFAASRALGFATSLVLARLLSPAEFGLVSFAMIAIGAFTLLQDLGTPAAIVYGRRDVAEIGGTALTINLAAALVLLAGVALGSPLLASFGGQAAIGPVATALALGLVLSAFGSVQNALLVKELALRRKFLPDVAPLVLSGGVSVILALQGLGVWALVGGYLVRSLATSLMLWWLSDVRPWPAFDRSIARELLGYGQHVSLTGLIGFATMNVDYLIVGHALGTAELGVYTLAFTIATTPAKAISELASKVIFPVYARLGGDSDGLAAFFSRVLALVGSLSLLTAAAISLGAPVYVPLVLGPKWAAVVAPLQVLSIFGALQSIGFNFPALYKAIGRPSTLWHVNLLKLVVLVPAMLLAVPFGITAIAIVHVAAEAAVLPIYALVLARHFATPPGRFLRGLAPSALALAPYAALRDALRSTSRA